MPQHPEPQRDDQDRTAGTEAVDDLEYRHAPGTRLHFAARQRRVDTAALGGLALHLPAFAFSLGALLAVGRLLDLAWQVPYWLPALIWLASGLLVFHQPAEDLYARYVLGFRYPLPGEHARLDPVWREVTARAGVEGDRYRLWVENTPNLNAYAAAGHIVGVTRFALENLPSAQLAAVLAHELGHHTGGHSWSTLAGRWYTLPARAAFRAGRAILLSAGDRALQLGSVATAALIAGCGVVLLGPAAILLGAAPLVLLALPYAAAALSRRAELRADLHAASLGFAPMLTEVLLAMEEGEIPSHSVPGPATSGMGGARPGPAAHLLASHPDYATRVHRLRPFLAPDR